MKKRQKAGQTFGTNIYRPNVLVGNWFEDRISDSTDLKAIIPCISSKSTCVNAKSVLKTDFLPPFPKYDDKGGKDYIDLKLDTYSNSLNGRSTNIKLFDGKQFEKNLTTTTDIIYRIERDKAEVEGDPHDHKGRKIRKLDMLHSYGNQTQTGLTFYKKCMEAKKSREPIDVSITHWNYPAKSVKHVIAKKCENKPSLIERQLEFIRNELQKPEYCPKKSESEPEPVEKFKC